MSLHVSRVAFGGLLLTVALGAGHVLAADAKAVADAIVAAASASGGQTTYDNASNNGDDVVITNLKSVSGSGDTLTVPSLVVSGAQPRDKGGFTAAKVSFDKSAMASDNNNVAIDTGSAADVIIPSAEEVKAKAKLRPFSRLDLTNLTVTGPDMAAAVVIASAGGAIDMDDAGIPRDFTMKIASIQLPPELFASEPQAKAILDQLGYTKGFTLNVDVAAGYDTASDTVSLRSITLDAPEVGKLSIAGKFSGTKLSKLTGGDDSDAIKNGKLDNFSIRFDNAGVVERGLDMQAKMMGGSRDDVVAQNLGALPMMLNMIGNPGFQDKINTAAQAFLKDPKSLTLSLAPATPVPFSQIMGAVDQPQTLPDVLSADIKANN